MVAYNMQVADFNLYKSINFQLEIARTSSAKSGLQVILGHASDRTEGRPVFWVIRNRRRVVILLLNGRPSIVVVASGSCVTHVPGACAYMGLKYTYKVYIHEMLV
jgi:hypothetical protein